VYTLRIPFLVPPATRVAEEEASLEHGSISYVLTWDGSYHILLVKWLASEAVALDFVAKAPTAIAWLLLQHGIAAKAELLPQKMQYYPDPAEAGAHLAKSFGSTTLGRADAIIDGSQAALFPSDKRLRVATALAPSVYTSIPSARALETLVEGFSFASCGRISQDPKLDLAVALYGAYFTEQSTRARFLTLIMSLARIIHGDCGTGRRRPACV
jgi:hypothetical protein